MTGDALVWWLLPLGLGIGIAWRLVAAWVKAEDRRYRQSNDEYWALRVALNRTLSEDPEVRARAEGYIEAWCAAHPPSGQPMSEIMQELIESSRRVSEAARNQMRRNP